MLISSAFAQTAPAAAAGNDIMSSLQGMLPLVLMFVVLYFVMIRPQMKRQKEHKAMIDALAKGDEVATSGGLLGKVKITGIHYCANHSRAVAREEFSCGVNNYVGAMFDRTN